jgi:hypothetical protein
MRPLQQQPGLTSHSPSTGRESSQVQGGHLEGPDAVSSYFECITACSLDDGDCVTRCVEVLREA